MQRTRSTVYMVLFASTNDSRIHAFGLLVSVGTVIMRVDDSTSCAPLTWPTLVSSPSLSFLSRNSLDQQSWSLVVYCLEERLRGFRCVRVMALSLSSARHYTTNCIQALVFECPWSCQNVA
jgi:hypothetical protein